RAGFTPISLAPPAMRATTGSSSSGTRRIDRREGPAAPGRRTHYALLHGSDNTQAIIAANASSARSREGVSFDTRSRRIHSGAFGDDRADDRMSIFANGR